MAPVIVPQFFLAAGAGVVGGLALLARGLAAYRRAGRVEGIATSTAASIAAGEVRLSGTIVPGPLVLISPLQSVECVYYDASMTESTGRDSQAQLLSEERSVEFFVRDATGQVRVIPGDAHWYVAPALDARASLMGDDPAGLALRDRAWTTPTPDREAAIAELLRVRHAATDGHGFSFTAPPSATFMNPRRAYREARLEPGQQVTIVGYAQDRATLDEQLEATPVIADAEIAADLAEARASGILAPDAETAWGNAAIPGFGIGRPTEPPTLHWDADPLPLADAATRAQNEAAFELPADELVVAVGPGVPLEIHAGTPRDAASRDRGQYLLGLAGGLIAIACALAIAVMLNGGL